MSKPAGFTALVATRVQDAGGNLLTGSLQVVPTDGDDLPLAAVAGGVGGAIVDAAVFSFSNGVLANNVWVPDSSQTTNQNTSYRFVFKRADGSIFRIWRGVQPRGAQLNLDTYQPNVAPQAVIQTGPQGTQGIQGAQGPTGIAGTVTAAGVSGAFSVPGLLTIGGSPVSVDSGVTVGFVQGQLGGLLDQALSYAQNALNLNQITFFNGKRGWRAGPDYTVFISDFGLTATQFPEFFSASDIQGVLDIFYLYPQTGTRGLPSFVDASGYNPGYYSGEAGARNSLPVGDPNWFMPLLERMLFQKTGLTAHFTANASALEASLALTPVDSVTGLVQNTSSVAYNAWLFQEDQADLGDMLIPSLFYIRSAKAMADLYASSGNASAASRWYAAMSKAIASLDTTSSSLWNATDGMFFHATSQNVQTDLVGSALAAYLTQVEGIAVCSSGQVTAISTYLNARYIARLTDAAPVFKAGYATYVSNPTNANAWTSYATSRTDHQGAGQYQNGGFWSVGNRWIQEALYVNSPIAAFQYALDQMSRRDPHVEWFSSTGQGTSPNLESIMGTFSFLRAHGGFISGSPPWMNGILESGGSRGRGIAAPDAFLGAPITGENDHRIFSATDANRSLVGITAPNLQETVYRLTTGESFYWETDFSVTPAVRRLIYHAPDGTLTTPIIVSKTGTAFGADLSGLGGPLVVDGAMKVAGTGSSASNYVGQISSGGDNGRVVLGELFGAASIGGNNATLNQYVDLHLQPGGAKKTILGFFGSAGILTIDNATGLVSASGSIEAAAVILADTNGHTYSYASVNGVLTPTLIS